MNLMFTHCTEYTIIKFLMYELPELHNSISEARRRSSSLVCFCPYLTHLTKTHKIAHFVQNVIYG